MNLQFVLRALAHRNFRLFFFGQGVSLIGTWMHQVAALWLVYILARRDSSEPEFWLGVAGFCGQIPSLVLAPIAGVLVERWNRQRLLLLTQSLAMTQAFVLAVLALTGIVRLWHILLLNLILGVVNAFDMTARLTFLPEIVDKHEDFASAIALNSSIVNGARLLGPAVAGLLLSWTSPGVCFLANALSYSAVLVALSAMRVQVRPRAPHADLLHGLREGFAYVRGFAPIAAVLSLLALVSLMGMSYTVLLPIFATRILGGAGGTFGLLSSATGFGALVGAGVMATRASVLGLGKWIALAPSLFGLALFAFSFSTSLWLSALLLSLVGFAMMTQMASSNTLLQTIVSEDKRGRVMSYYTMAFLGMAPLGSLLAGALAAGIGAPNMVRISAVSCIAGSILFALNLPRLRALIQPIYVRMGILPELAAGAQPPTGPDPFAGP